MVVGLESSQVQFAVPSLQKPRRLGSQLMRDSCLKTKTRTAPADERKSAEFTGTFPKL